MILGLIVTFMVCIMIFKLQNYLAVFFESKYNINHNVTKYIFLFINFILALFIIYIFYFKLSVLI